MSRVIPALSIRQPWAWLIVNGHKDIENRVWTTPYRGRFLVHAGKTFSRAYYDEQASALAKAGLMPAGFPTFEHMASQTGGIVGEATLVDCVGDSDSPWHLKDHFGFVLAEAHPLPFAPMPGRLQFFNVRVPE
jgi:hypothetical protein